MLEHGANPNEKDNKGETPLDMLHGLLEKNSLEIAEILFSHGAKFNPDFSETLGKVYMRNAIENGNITVVNALIKYNSGLASYIDGQTSLHYAIANTNRNIAMLLISNKAAVNATNNRFGTTPLHLAAQIESKELVSLLLLNGSIVNAKDNDGHTALHFACNSPDITSLLLEHGADVNADDNNGKTPLNYAARCGQKQVAEILIKNKANIYGSNPSNWQPLQEAADKGDIEIVNLLLNNGANINVNSNSCAITPLHLAAQKGDQEMVRLLLSRGVDVNSAGLYSQTPLDFAKKNVTELLRHHGAKTLHEIEQNEQEAKTWRQSHGIYQTGD